MQHIKHVIISCAGLGTRLGLDKPKCMVEIKGRKLIDYLLDICRDVEDVRIIVGFKELDVIDHVRSIRPDVTFVRNSNYASTSNSYSVYLATRDLKDPFIIIDGDMIIDPSDFRRFLDVCAQSENDVVGISRSKTEEAVFVDLNSKEQVAGFKRSPKTDYEWCGIALLQKIRIDPEEGYVYKHFIDQLPLQTFTFNCYEIDTPDDLIMAELESYSLLNEYSERR